jgi:hypothetical protein
VSGQSVSSLQQTSPSFAFENAKSNGITSTATPLSTGRKRGPVAKRRFQKGCFVTEPDGRMYSMFYMDDASGQSKRVKQFLGKSGQMSERAALREHARIMEDVNRRRGSVAPAYRSQSFAEVTELWRRAIAPNLSPSTVRQREPICGFTSSHDSPELQFNPLASKKSNNLPLIYANQCRGNLRSMCWGQCSRYWIMPVGAVFGFDKSASKIWNLV